MATSHHAINDMLARLDIRVGGSRPWDIQVHNPRLYRRVLTHGSKGLGEAYMDGWWDCARLDQLFHRIHQAGIVDLPNWTSRLASIAAYLSNLQKPSRAFQIGKRHYDIGNDLYRAMLGPSMIYSCAYWRNARSLEEAQEAKLDLVCRKLDLRPGMRVLDIGCGWGGAARFAAERYGVHVTGVTVSKEQAILAQNHCSNFPVEIRLADYRTLEGEYDHIFSIGMFEHVGHKNHDVYMHVVKRLLKPGGRFLLHTIGNSRTVRRADAWIAAYIFPNSLIPSSAQIARASEGTFVMEDWHNFGADYDSTLMRWHANFENAWPDFRDTYGDRFYRMWNYYLLLSAGAFRARKLQLWQVLYSDSGIRDGFKRWQADSPGWRASVRNERAADAAARLPELALYRSDSIENTRGKIAF